MASGLCFELRWRTVINLVMNYFISCSLLVTSPSHLLSKHLWQGLAAFSPCLYGVSPVLTSYVSPSSYYWSSMEQSSLTFVLSCSFTALSGFYLLICGWVLHMVLKILGWNAEGRWKPLDLIGILQEYWDCALSPEASRDRTRKNNSIWVLNIFWVLTIINNWASRLKGMWRFC